MKNLLKFGLVICFLAASSAWANTDTKAAQGVIENWFKAMKEDNQTQAAEYLAPGFVSIHTDGIVRNKSEEMDLIKNLHMKDYQLTAFKFSNNNKDIIVVTFKDAGNEKIDNKPIADKAAGRMAVLQKDKGKWMIIAYANLDEIK